MMRMTSNFGWKFCVQIAVMYMLVKGLMSATLNLLRLSYCKKTLGVDGTACQTLQVSRPPSRPPSRLPARPHLRPCQASSDPPPAGPRQPTLGRTSPSLTASPGLTAYPYPLP